MDLLADENVPRPIIERLRLDGWKVRSIAEGHAGLDDIGVLREASPDHLILITQDHDFGMLCIAEGLAVAGVLLVELARLSLPSQVQRIASFMKSHAQDLPGPFVVLEQRRFRLRPLPGPAKH